MAKRTKTSGPTLTDVVVRIQHKPAMTKDAWLKAGRPYWLLGADEPDGPDRCTVVYYRTWIPAWEKLDVLARTTVHTVRMRAGVILDRETPPPEVQPVPVSWEEANALVDQPGGPPRPKRHELWGRSWTEANAQHYDTCEEVA